MYNVANVRKSPTDMVASLCSGELPGVNRASTSEMVTKLQNGMSDTPNDEIFNNARALFWGLPRSWYRLPMRAGPRIEKGAVMQLIYRNDLSAPGRPWVKGGGSGFFRSGDRGGGSVESSERGDEINWESKDAVSLVRPTRISCSG